MHWRAVLVESTRIDGKPRQRHIAYLAGFTESAARIPAQRRLIWERIEKHLERLGKRIPAKDREAIMAALIEKIGKPPTKAQRAKLDRQQKANNERGNPCLYASGHGRPERAKQRNAGSLITSTKAATGTSRHSSARRMPTITTPRSGST